MAIQAVNLHTIKDVSHPSDTGDEKTIFHIGAIDSRVLGSLNDRATKISLSADAGENPEAETGVQVNQHQLTFETVQFGLKGWTNFRDENGDIQFGTEGKVLGSKRYDVAKGDLVARLPQNVIQWLSREIAKLNSVTDDEGKS